MVKILLENCAQPQAALNEMAAKNKVDAVQALLAAQADLAYELAKGWTAALVAAKHNAVETLQLLGGVGASSSTGLTAGMVACMFNHPEAMALSVHSNTLEVSTDGRCWVHHAILSDCPPPSEQTASLLAAVGCRDAAAGWTGLHLAAHLGAEEWVATLLRAGAGLEELDVQGRSPLVLCTAQGHTRVAKVLLRAGASSSGAFAVALATQSQDIAAILLHYGVAEAEIMQAVRGGMALVERIEQLRVLGEFKRK